MTRSGISLVIAALLLQAPATRAAQLDKDSCAKLKNEQAQIEQGGTRGSMGKGPEWAVNLAELSRSAASSSWTSSCCSGVG